MGFTPTVIQHAIVTYARSWSALAAVRSLGTRGIRVWAGDVVPLGAATFSKYTVGSFTYPAEEKAFIKTLIAKCTEIRKKYGGSILLLPIHEETYVISQHRKEFPSYVHLVLPDNDVLQRIQHKGELIALAKKHRVNMPPSWYCKTRKQALKIANELSFPAYVKQPEGSGSTGIYRIESKEAYEKKVRTLALPLVVQGFVDGNDYCCCALFDHGKPVALMTYTALQTYPVRGGTTVYRKTIKSDIIEKEAIKLLSGTKWHGVAEIDFRVGPDAKAYLIEVNPRFWGGLNHAIKANIDYPGLVWRLAEGHHVPRITHVRKNVRTGNFIGALAATMEELAAIDKIGPACKAFVKRPTWKRLWKVFAALPTIVPHYRRHLIKGYLQRQAVDDIYDPKDPLAMAGLLFPLSIYAKYGKVNEKLLIDAAIKSH